jgi:hypothetical protein
MTRELLPNRRRNSSFEFTHAGMTFTCCCGYYRDGRISELFLSSTKPGSAVEALARDAAVCISIALQHGTPIQTLRAAVTRDDGGNATTAIGQALDELAGVRP